MKVPLALGIVIALFCIPHSYPNAHIGLFLLARGTPQEKVALETIPPRNTECVLDARAWDLGDESCLPFFFTLETSDSLAVKLM